MPGGNKPKMKSSIKKKMMAKKQPTQAYGDSGPKPIKGGAYDKHLQRIKKANKPKMKATLTNLRKKK